MKVAIYARVSDDKLKEDGERRQDVQRQVERLMPYAQADAEGEVLLFIDDAKTAFKEDHNSRPEFLRLMREIRANRVHKVYVESLDRWSRRVVDGLTTLGEVSQYNCTVQSINEGEAEVTSNHGWLKTAFFLVMAEYASRDKADKVRSGMKRRANDTRYLCRSCNVIHLGRHPKTCQCPKCRKKG